MVIYIDEVDVNFNFVIYWGINLLSSNMVLVLLLMKY
jgi:hypothetical protein